MISVKLACLLEDPTVSVGMISWFIGVAMNLAGSIQYSVQVGWFISIRLEWLLPLTGLRATESSINGRVFGVIAIIATLVFVASGLGVAISSI